MKCVTGLIAGGKSKFFDPPQLGAEPEAVMMIMMMMSKLIPAAAIAVVFGTAAANATENPLITASALTRLCEGTATAEQLSCVSFLGGVYGATIALGQLVGPPVLCSSRDVSGEELLTTFRDYARRHPPALDNTASVFALIAFREAYGCKQ